MKSIKDYQREIRKRTEKGASEKSLYKLRQLILYIASRCEYDRMFGATKLNKILYYADFLSYREYGEPITGVPYMKLENGPAPVHLVIERDKMIKDGLIALREQPLYKGVQKRIVPLTEADLSPFSGREIALVDYVIEQLRDQTATEVSDLSHGRVWRIAGEKEVIPYEAALLSEDDLTQADIEKAKKLARERGWKHV
jgi:hypothetical protein